MAEELIARRRKMESDLAANMKKRNLPVSDRSLARTRLAYAGHNVGVTNPSINMINPVTQKNIITPQLRQRMTEAIKTTKDELRTSMRTAGIQPVTRDNSGRHGVFLEAENPELPEPEIDRQLTPEEKARLDYIKLQQQKNIDREQTITMNRYLSDHIYNTTKHTDTHEEVHREMRDSDISINIQSHKDYLNENHKSMHNSDTYRNIAQRRKHISMCQTVDGVLSDDAIQLQNTTIEFDIDRVNEKKKVNKSFVN